MISKKKKALDQTAAKEKPKTHFLVVMPAYNAAQTLRQAHQEIPYEYIDAVILVDDHSVDKTVEIAKELGMITIKLNHNVGYGNTQQLCYLEALRQDPELIGVVMIHGDMQYRPIYIPEIIAKIKNEKADVVLGSRFLTRGGALSGNMPIWKFWANRFLTVVENMVLGLGLSEYHTGLRGYSRNFLETVPFLRNSNDFVFDTEILIQAAAFKMKIAEIPIETYYFKEASSINFKVSTVYGLKTLGALLRFTLHRLGWHSKKYSR